MDKSRLKRVAARYHLDLIVLFGSQAKGRACADSDLDVAVRAYKPGWVANRRVPRWQWQLDVIGAVGAAVEDKHEADVSFLNHATPLFLIEVARHGQLLYEKKAGDFIVFKSYAARIYYDNEKFFRLTEQYLEKEFGGKPTTRTHRAKAEEPQAVSKRTQTISQRVK